MSGRPSRHNTDDSVYTQGSLSEYSDSDYLSSDGEIMPPSRGAPPTSASSSAGHALPGVGARSYAQYVSNDTAGGKGLLEAGADDEEDPFADPFADPNTPSVEQGRYEWKEI